MKRDPRIAVAIAIIAIAFVLLILAALPASWWERHQAPANHPLAAEIVPTAAGKPVTVPTGARLEPSGFLSISAVPPSPAQPTPDTPRSAAHGPSPPPVAGKIAAGIRLVARLRPMPVTGELLPGNLLPPPRQFARIVLRDGCFRIDEPGDPIAVFDVGTSLWLDDAGYLMFGQGAGSAIRARVGEPIWWEGERRAISDPATLAELHARCGRGKAELVGLAQSLSLGQALADGESATNIVDMYGIPWARALDKVRECRAKLSKGPGGAAVRMVATPCGTTPPPPVTDPAHCPPGTAIVAGICRTPDGFIRPIPDWLKA